jgi:putative flippase GtrA
MDGNPVSHQINSHPINSHQIKPAGQRTAAGFLPAQFPLGLKIGFWACIVIAVATVLRRVVALSTPPSPNAPPQLASLDAYFAAHATFTYIHILCALVFVMLLPLLFWRRTRSSLMLERVIFPLGLVVGITAYAMSTHAVGGWLERAAVLFFNTLFLFALYRAWSFARSRNRPQTQRWMLRAIAILLGIATTRPVMGVFFATSPLTHLTPAQFFGIAFWIGFSLNTVVMEFWLRTKGKTALA